MDLEGKIALVTGAGKRVGKAIALMLTEAGADIALHYHSSADEARATAEQINALGRRCELFQADLTQPQQIAELFEAVGSSFGRLDVLVNNAAVCDRTPLESLTAGQWDRQFAVNARAPALCIRRAAAIMTDGGAIINIADVSGKAPWAGYPAYCASKAALLALTESAAKALAPRIRVNAVSPGVALWDETIGQQQRDKVIAHVPMRRAGCPQDVAAAVVFLARQDYITGQNLRVDGGWNMK